jgi:hypothetical protein
MPKQARFNTQYPGVYYIMSYSSSINKSERVYYIRYRQNDKSIEEKAGRQFRIDRGRERAIANQVFMHRPPLGYKLHKGQLVLCEKTAPIVQCIFVSYNMGKAIKAIAREHGKSPASIRYILNNPFYINSSHLIPHELLV